MVAHALAEKLGWRCVSTDNLAKHPGRPWRQTTRKVPDQVAEHYLSSKAHELVESVILHHRKMSPLVAELVRTTVKGLCCKFLNDAVRVLLDGIQATIASNCSFSVGAGLKAKRPWRFRII